MQKENKPLGRHVIAEFYGCNSQKINDLNFVKDSLKKAVDLSHSTLVDVLCHEFSPQGITGIALIMESHLSIHTWPENGYVAVDFFSCNLALNFHETIVYLGSQFCATTTETKLINRGEKAINYTSPNA